MGRFLPMPFPRMFSSSRRRLAAALAVAMSLPAAQAMDRSLTLAQLHHASWSTREGAPAQVESMAQTDDGLLWLGTATGLFSFDGLQFERFEPPADQAGASGSVSTLFAGADAGLWIGYRFGGIGWLKDGRLRTFGPADGVPAGTVTALARDGTGHMWVGTTRGAARFDGRRWTMPDAAGALPAGPIYALHADRFGTMWAAAEDGTWRLPPGGSHFERSTRSISFAWLAERQNGDVWEANGTQGVWRLPSADAPAPLHAAVPGPGALGPLLFDDSGSLWLGTSDGVLRVPDSDAMPALSPDGTPTVDPAARIRRRDGLSGDQVMALLEDREGDVWVSTNGGLDRFRAPKLRREPLPPHLFWPSIAPASGGGVWVGSTESSAVRIGGPPLALPAVGPRITSVLRDAHGRVWMAGALGLWRIGGDEAHRMTIPTAASGVPIQSLMDGADGRLRMSVLSHGLWEQDGPDSSGWHPVPIPAGSPDGIPLAMLRSPDGRIWQGYAGSRLVATDAGSGQVAAGWAPAQGLRVGSVLCLHAQGDKVWVGGEMGVAAIASGRVHPVRIAGGEPAAGVSGIVHDAGGNVWLNTATGILRLPAADVERAMHDPAWAVAAERLDFHDGLDGAPAQLRPIPTAVVDDQGRLWFATNNSLVSIAPEAIARNPVPPGVLMRSLTAAGRRWPFVDAVLPRYTREVDLRYAATALAQPDRVRFRVMLEGVDANWRDAGPQRTAHYSNLAPGRYRFLVLAANEDGVWSTQPAQASFTVTPAFWQTVWFRLLCVLPALALAWWLVRWRAHRMAQRFADRHEAMLVERERIARELHDTLLQSVQGLVLRVQAGVNRLGPTDPVRAALERAVDRADGVLFEARDRVNALRGGRPVGTSLGQQLQQAGDDLALDHPGQFFSVISPDEPALAGALQEEVLRIGTEALRNAFQHAQASEVRLTLQQTSRGLALEIADDGRGMALDTGRDGRTRGHWGIPGMHERARAIGGRLTIVSAPGAGTRVRLQVRLRRSPWYALLRGRAPFRLPHDPESRHDA